MIVLQMPRANEPRVKARRCRARALFVALTLVGLAVIGGRFQALAQSGEGGWTTPVNLSHSGAASKPAIVAGPDDMLRVFWWDQFEGPMAADGPVPVAAPSETWSEPAPARIFLVETITTTVEAETPEGETVVEEELVFTPIETMPRIVADAAGRAHAFWLGEPSEAEEPDEETGAQPLMYSRLSSDSTSWSWADVVTRSAASFDVATDTGGTLHLVYVRASHSQSSPAGLYYRRSNDGGATWGASKAIYQSRYFRLFSSGDTSEDAHVRLAVDNAGGVYITWDDPHLKQVVLAHSADGGVTWQTSGPIGDHNGRPQGGQIIAVSGGEVLLLWEDARVEGTCRLYQASASELLTGAERRGQRVLEGLTTCLGNKQFLPLGEGQALMMASSGGDTLTLTAWDGERWSEPKRLSFRFMDPELGEQVYLSNLQAALVQTPPDEENEQVTETLVVVGTDQNNEVWITGSPVEALERTFAPPPPHPTPLPVEGEKETEPSVPVNLSRSWAASSPAIVAGSDEVLHVFWWDQFDGLMVADGAILASSVLSGTEEIRTVRERWSEPRLVPAPAATTPWVMADASGRVHAFWLGEAEEETDARPLVHSRLTAAGTTWLLPDVLAESVVSFDVVTDGSGALHLAYLRVLHTPESPAGLYYRRSDDGGAIWSTPVALDTSRYFRLLPSEEAQVRLAADGAGGVYVIWDDPRLEQVWFALSDDGGATWQPPRTVGDPDGWSQRGRVVAVPGGQVLLLWEDARAGGQCGLYQTSANELLAGTEEAGKRVLEELTACPKNERFLSLGEGQVLMVAGNGSDVLTLAAWDGERWSEPRQLNFRFEDPGSGEQIYLGDLQAVLVALSPNAGEGLEGKALIAVGVDQEGDVWVTNSQMGALKLVFAPPPPWSTPIRLSQAGAEAGWPAVALDAEGGVHVVWSQVYPELSRRGAGEGGPGTGLFYARWDGSTGRWSRTVEVVGGASGEEMARQPALLADPQGMLHLVWSGGEQGRIFYKRARINEARWSGGWSRPQPLPAPASIGSWPQIGVDAAGRLYVVYAVPLNEERGIYLTRSDDGGKTWSEPEVVFAAATAGWAMADHPALSVAPDGTLHVAWMRGALPGTWPPQGIYYTRSDNGGNGWTEPLEVAESSHDWPRLALAGGQVHLLYAKAGGDVWHRWSDAGSQAGTGNGWSTETRIPGWKGVAGPFGLAASGPPAGSGATLHLVGADAEGEVLLYSAWDGSHWSAAETFGLGSEMEVGFGVSAAILPQGGWLAVALRALEAGGEEEAAPVVFYAARTIPTVEALPPPAPTLTPTVTPSPTPEPTAAPSPTPDLTSGPPPSAPSMDPLLLGGGLAGVIVVGMLVTRGLWMRRQ